MHGGGEDASHEGIKMAVPYARKNDIVMLFPQADKNWNVHTDMRLSGEDTRYFTK